MKARHFLTLTDLTPDELASLIQRAVTLKSLRYQRKEHTPFKNKVLALLMEKSSTRTRVSFESAVNQGGGSAIFLSAHDTQLGRGEPLEDTAQVLSRMVDIIVIRTYQHETLERFAAHSHVPVINGLTDRYHPCQILADIQAYTEHRGSIEAKTVVWIGDTNNMCLSYLDAARQFKFDLRVCTPWGYGPNHAQLARAQGAAVWLCDPQEAVRDADLIVTDVWASMGQEHERNQRLNDFTGYQVTSQLMALAKPNALFMHCLPAHRSEEVSAKVIDGPQSIVWDEAENRLHSQKALLEFFLS